MFCYFVLNIKLHFVSESTNKFLILTQRTTNKILLNKPRKYCHRYNIRTVLTEHQYLSKNIKQKINSIFSSISPWPLN